MSLLKQWNELIDGQTDETFNDFWQKYAGTEQKIYRELLANKQQKVTGTFQELADHYQADPVIFMGFLDGINTSLKKEQKLDAIKEESKLSFEIQWEKLYFNMWKAEAEYLYTLPEWDGILTKDQQKSIEREFKQSKIAHAEKKPGRNDPCPCGSGKKYKNCCGKNN